MNNSNTMRKKISNLSISPGFLHAYISCCSFLFEQHRLCGNLSFKSYSSVFYTWTSTEPALNYWLPKHSHKEQFTMKCAVHGQHNNHFCMCGICLSLLWCTVKLPFVFMCVCACRCTSQESLHPTQKAHTWRLVTLWDRFLSWDDTCIITLWAHLPGLSLKAFLRCYSLAAKSIALKDAVPSEPHTWNITTVPDSLLFCQEPNILHICQYSFSWTENSGSSNFQTLRTFSGENK